MKRHTEDFELIYDNYYSYVHRFLLKHTNGDLDLVEELTQETFYQVFVSLHRYRGECDIRTWICKIALNVMYTYFKKNRNYISFEEVADYFNHETVESAEDIYIRTNDLTLLRNAIFKLRKNQRDVIIYRVYLQMTFAEIGKMLNISEANAKVLYHRGKEKIKYYI